MNHLAEYGATAFFMLEPSTRAPKTCDLHRGLTTVPTTTPTTADVMPPNGSSYTTTKTSAKRKEDAAPTDRVVRPRNKDKEADLIVKPIVEVAISVSLCLFIFTNLANKSKLPDALSYMSGVVDADDKVTNPQRQWPLWLPTILL